MTEEEINNVNKKCQYNQGIFKEPYGIPVHIKEPVIYTRYETGGYQGGSCWGTDAEPYCTDEPEDKFEVLDFVLEVLMPNITYLQYKKIMNKLVHDNYESEYEYYGNSTDWKIEYIVLSELEELLKTF